MNSGEKLVGNSFFLFTDWAAVTVLSLLYWLIIGKTLPPESYGIISASVNFMIMVSGFTLIGMQLAVPKLVAEYSEIKQHEKMKSLIAFSLRVVITISVAASAVIVLLSGFLQNMLNLPAEALLIISVGIVASSLWSLSTSIIIGLQNMKYIFRTNLIGNILKIALAFLLIIFGFNYVGPLISVVASFILIVALRRKFLHLRSGKVGVDKKGIVMNYAMPAFIAGVVMMFFGSTPTIILNAIKGAAVTGLLAIAMTVSSPLAMIPSTLTQALFPITSALSTQASQKKKQMTLINLVTRYALFLTIPAFIILVVFSEKILLLFSRPEYLPAASLMPLVALSTVLLGMGGIFNSNIYAMRKPKVSRNIVIFSTALFLLFVFPLTYMFSSIGTAASYFAATLSYAALSYLYLRKSIGLRVFSVSVAKLLALNILFGLVLYSTRFPDNILIKFLVGILGILMYLGLPLLMKYYSAEDVRVITIIAQKSPVLKRQLNWLAKFISNYS